jgi:hypothetical protein
MSSTSKENGVRRGKFGGSIYNRNIYKIRRNKVNNMIIHAKEQFYLNANGLLDENSNNPKAFWSLVKNVMGNCRSTVIPPLIMVYLFYEY